ncbi:MAG: ATPase [Megasphaera sp.]|jgi:cell division septum initiation protein DivIVA|nr:ATPase [Megasphaera sp.]MCH4187076.1 ATPase [Megasphaera sp.]MCH4216988.1 ATPase [Megasphaera sp.]
MNSDKLLEDLESLVMNASKMPFTNKKMIEEEEILQIIDDLKESMPAELEQSKKILAEKDKILSDAQHHADSMVAQAKDYIAKLTEESELVRQAQEHANQIILNANQSSEELKNSSITYAGDVLKYVETTLDKTLSSIKQNRDSLLQSNHQEGNKQ